MLKRLLTAGILVLLATAVHAAGLYPLSRQQQFDANGRPLGGARLFLFDGGTTTPRVGYRDLALTTPHPNPILADSAGRFPLIYLDDGFYKHRLTSKTGTLIFEDDGIPVLTTSAGGSGTTVDPDSVFKTRDIKIRFDDQPLAGYVRLNGRTIGSASSGATERANTDTQSLYEELWSFANISVTGGKGASAAADFAANKPLVLPNAAGRGIFGMDDLGAGAQSVLTSATCTGPTLPGATCGAQVITIAASNLPVSSPWLATAVTTAGGTATDSGTHQHTASGWASGFQNAGHDHSGSVSVSLRNLSNGAAGGDFSVYAPSGTGSSIPFTTGGQSNDHFHGGISGTTDFGGSHTHPLSISASTSVTMQSNSGGAQAMSKLPPIITLMIFIRL